MISPSLAISDGCSWNGPIWNQPWVPFWREPSGERTSTSRRIDAP